MLDKNNANAYFNRGCCYDSVGELDLAISDYSVALELDMKESENDTQRNEEEDRQIEEPHFDEFYSQRYTEW